LALYELRTYTLHVGKMAEAVKLYQEIGFPALRKGGQDQKLVGYFQSDTGTINQLVHLWKFDDDADRRAHWAGLSANKALVEGFASKSTAADDPGGEAPAPSAVGAASVKRSGGHDRSGVELLDGSILRPAPLIESPATYLTMCAGYEPAPVPNMAPLFFRQWCLLSS
jgi:NIPSNAP